MSRARFVWLTLTVWLCTLASLAIPPARACTTAGAEMMDCCKAGGNCCQDPAGCGPARPLPPPHRWLVVQTPIGTPAPGLLTFSHVEPTPCNPCLLHPDVVLPCSRAPDRWCHLAPLTVALPPPVASSLEEAR